MENKLTVGFMGSGRFAARCLELISQRLRPQWVVTNAPRAAGRGMKMQQTPVFDAAETLGIQTFTTEKLSADSERLEWIKDHLPDAILVIDFGHMIKEPLLSMPRLGCINIHPSKLPQFRGSAPVQRAVMQGLTETAVSVFRLEAGMDSGPILAQPALKIAADDDISTVYENAAVTGTRALLELLCNIPPEKWTYSAQDETKTTFAPKIEKEEGRIDWERPASEIRDLVRGIGSAPGVFCTAKGKRLRIHKAGSIDAKSGAAGTFSLIEGVPAVACGSGSLLLEEVQPEGKKRQSAADWARGARLADGESLL